MPSITERAISERELAVVLAALAQAPAGEVSADLLASVPKLRVIGQCECGCDSIFFKRLNATGHGRRVADGTAVTSNGEEMGVLVWAIADEITDLELYNYSDELARLPDPISIRPYDGTSIDS